MSYEAMKSDQNQKPTIRLWGDSLTEGRPGVACMDMLAQGLPEFEFINHGRGGDTVAGLLRRLKAVQPEESAADLSVLWIGVNDVYAQMIPGHHWWKSALRQKPTRDFGRFAKIFDEILKELHRRSRIVLVLPPLFVGENPETRVNQRLSRLSELIGDLTVSEPACRYLNIRDSLPLDSGRSSGYLPVNPFALIADSFGRVEDADFDRAGDRRGLRWTCDGLHLNSAGAGAVSRRLATEIRRILEEIIT